MAKRKKEVPKEENKSQRFIRVVQPRVGKAIKSIGLVGSVTGSTYDYSNEQAEQIVEALQDAVDKVAARFEGTVDTASGFSLR